MRILSGLALAIMPLTMSLSCSRPDGANRSVAGAEIGNGIGPATDCVVTHVA